MAVQLNWHNLCLLYDIAIEKFKWKLFSFFPDYLNSMEFITPQPDADKYVSTVWARQDQR